MIRTHMTALICLCFFASSAHAGDPIGDYSPAFCTSQNPSDGLAPVIVGPVYAQGNGPLYPNGAVTLHVHNQSTGSTLQFFTDSSGLIGGPIATKNNSAFNPTGAIFPNDTLSVCQTGALQSICSNEVTVQSQPGSLPRPLAPHTVQRGAYAIEVSNVFPGATVTVSNLSGTVLGSRFSGVRTSVSVPIPETLPSFSPLLVTQTVGTLTSEAGRTLILPGVPVLNAPEILGPVERGDVAVTVSGVTPGSFVEIIDAGTGAVLASKAVGEPIAKVAACGLDGATGVYARATRNGTSIDGPTLAFFDMPASLTVTESSFDFGASSSVPRFDLAGQKWRPWISRNDAPALFIVHGNRPFSGGTPDTESHLGYTYIAERLASYGIHVYSLSIPEDDVLPDERASVLLDLVEEVVAGHGDASVTESSNLAFLGHSLGGEAVILAAQDSPRPLAGLVAIAPTTHFFDELRPWDGVDSLHLFGTEDDYFITGVSTLRALAQYDFAHFEKTQVFVRGLGHNAPNSYWNSQNPDGILSLFEVQDLMQKLVEPWVFGKLSRRFSEVRGFYQGTTRRKGLNHFDMTFQYSNPSNIYPVDGFGDISVEFVIPDWNQDPFENAQGGIVYELNSPAAPVLFEDQHYDLATVLPNFTDLHFEHMQSAVLAWDQTNYRYVSEIPGVHSLSSSDVLSLRAMVVGDDALNHPSLALPQDFMLGISDGTHTALVRAGSQGEVHYPWQSADTNDEVHVFQTIRIPLSAFIASNPDIDIDNITEVRIQPRVRRSGRIIIDDLRFSD